MSSHEPTPGDANTAQTLSRNHVVVTGAGFTRAVVPGAPLLVDDFNNDDLENKVRGLPNASRLLDWERSMDERGHIDIERLMTRLDTLMPYDHAESAGNAANEYSFLLSELKRSFLDRLHEARNGDVRREELKRFATYQRSQGMLLRDVQLRRFPRRGAGGDRQMEPVLGIRVFLPFLIGHGCHGRGVYTGTGVPAVETPRIDQLAAETGLFEPGRNRQHHTPSRVVRWRLCRSAGPRSPGAQTRNGPAGSVEVQSCGTAGASARLVAGVDRLATAHEVTFVGYSFPTTDTAARTLFSEALKDLPRDDITVVNLSREEPEAELTRRRYPSVFGDIPDERFHFGGALKWIRGLSR